jgi:hypothetical protein
MVLEDDAVEDVLLGQGRDLDHLTDLPAVGRDDR